MSRSEVSTTRTCDHNGTSPRQDEVALAHFGGGLRHLPSHRSLLNSLSAAFGTEAQNKATCGVKGWFGTCPAIPAGRGKIVGFPLPRNLLSLGWD
jgi:hypothetical protein